MRRQWEPGARKSYGPEDICSREGCEQPPKGRGLCNTHYAQYRRSPEFAECPPANNVTCAIEGCDRPMRYRGWCNTHVLQWRRTGSPYRLKLPGGTDEDRFWRKVDKEGPNGCWLWTGSLSSAGYGRFRQQGETGWAHRFAYELLVGPIPDGMHVDHVYERGCRNRNCVNPAHLEPVTQTENNRRMIEVRRAKRTLHA